MAGTRARRKAERPGEILEAALEEFALRGFAATRLEDVAARAGVTKGTIYFYFENKERLFETLITELSPDPISVVGEEGLAWSDDLAGDLDRYLTAVYTCIGEKGGSSEILRLLIAEAPRFPALVDDHFARFMTPVVERLRGRLDLAVARGEMPPASTLHLPEVVLGPMLALKILVLLFANRRPLDPDSYLASQRAVMLDGILAGRRLDLAGDGWTAWRPFPDPRTGGMLHAPLGPGLFELRLENDETLLFGAVHSVAGRLAGLLPQEIVPEQRRTTTRRRFLASRLPDLRYRTRATPTYADAVEEADTMNPRPYRFGRLR